MATNLHGSALLLGDGGVLITGASGSGKTALALELLARARAGGLFAALVADDQVFVAAHHGRVIVSVPASIAGLVEVRGLGMAALGHESRAVTDLVVELVPKEQSPRFSEPLAMDLAGVPVRCLRLPEREPGGAAQAVLALLALPPYIAAGRAPTL